MKFKPWDKIILKRGVHRNEEMDWLLGKEATIYECIWKDEKGKQLRYSLKGLPTWWDIRRRYFEDMFILVQTPRQDKSTVDIYWRNIKTNAES